MKSSSDLGRRLNTVRNALNSGLISTEEAEQLVAELEFYARQADILQWGAHYFPDKFTLPFCHELHDYLVSTAEEPFTNTLAPRGHAKTTIRCFLIPTFYALNHPDKFRHYLNIQATSTKAAAINLGIRVELEQNERLIADYGRMIGDKWTERQFVLTNGVIFTAVGAGESVRGLNYRNVRPDHVVADDLYDEDSIENPNMVRKINRWFWSSIYKCVANDRPVSIHILGTAINREDLMHELSKNPRWRFCKFQAVKDWDAGTLLWHENPANTIEKQRQDKADMGSIIYSREMQNDVRDDETSIIKYADIRFYDGRQFPSKAEAERIKHDEYLPEIPEHVVWNRGWVDPAEKEKEVNDFTARVAAVKTNLGNIYVYDAANEKLSFHSNKTEIVAWARRCGLQRLGIETNKGQALYDEIRRTTDLPVEGKHETKDKITRKLAQSAKFENHKVFISMLIPEPLRNEIVDQLTTNKPPHDDLSDAVINILEFDNKRDLFIG